MSNPSVPSGLPDERTLAERLDAYEAERKDYEAKVRNIAVAFGKLPTEDRDSDDLAARVIRAFNIPGDTIELHLSEVEAISRRIAELNSMAMQGRLTSDDAERVMRAAEEAAQGYAEGRVARQAAIEAREEADRVAPYRKPDSPL